jgi:hypothetical protein
MLRISKVLSLVTICILLTSCDNNSHQENIKNLNQNTSSTPQSVKNQLTNGVTYRYFKYLSCQDSDGIKCFDNEFYEKLCKSSEGFTKWAAIGTSTFDHVGRHLIDNGQMEDYRIEWLPSGYCRINVTFSGIYNGSSARKNLTATVYSFILSNEGNLLAHDTSSL